MLVVAPCGQFRQTTADCAAGNTGCHRRRRYTALASGFRLTGRDQPTSALVKKRRQRYEPGPDCCNVDHRPMLSLQQAAPHQPSGFDPCEFHAVPILS
jgi:hypothetical protein